jgi:hypothetical protein
LHCQGANFEFFPFFWVTFLRASATYFIKTKGKMTYGNCLQKDRNKAAAGGCKDHCLQKRMGAKADALAEYLRLALV